MIRKTLKIMEMMYMDCNNVSLKKGSSGSQVTELQKYLAYLGLYTRQIDGDFGSYTETAVKKMQKQYGNTQDGWFGPKTCNACGINGQDISNSIQAVELEVFKDMTNRRDTFIKENGREPNICYIDISNKYRYVTNEKYKDMKERYDAFIVENGREPNVCYINKPATVTSSDTGNGSFTQKFIDAVGSFSTFKGAYNNCKYRGYSGYNNDVYDQATALKRLKNKSGLNCSDMSQLLYALAVDMGLTVRYVHIRCKSGLGHIVIDVKSKGDSNYTRVDGAAALSSGYTYGNYWCSSGTVISYDDAWLMTDDGVT